MKPNADLHYFVHNIDGVDYGAWYRIVSAHSIEILAPGFIAILPLDNQSIEEVSCRALEQFIRRRLEEGSPVPPAEQVSVNDGREHTCKTGPN